MHIRSGLRSDARSKQKRMVRYGRLPRRRAGHGRLVGGTAGAERVAVAAHVEEEGERERAPGCGTEIQIAECGTQ